MARPDSPTVGSDCEVLVAGVLREPVAAVSSLAITAAGWVIARHRAIPGVALLLAGLASLAAHGTAHPTARVLDGIAAGVAAAAVVWSVVTDRPDRKSLGPGILIGLVAVAVWLLTRTGAPLCDAVGAWGHAAWHVLVAAAAVAALGESRADSDR
jgi:hypothetical protein